VGFSDVGFDEVVFVERAFCVAEFGSQFSKLMCHK